MFKENLRSVLKKRFMNVMEKITSIPVFVTAIVRIPRNWQTARKSALKSEFADAMTMVAIRASKRFMEGLL